jgi:putative heme-binding domain-containing protein
VGIVCALAKHPSAAVRRAAIEYSSLPVTSGWNDSDPQVRLTALLAMTKPTDEQSLPIITKEFSEILRRDDICSDPNFRDAITMAAIACPEFIEEAFAQKPGSNALRIIETAMSNAARRKRLDFLFKDDSLFRRLSEADPALASAIVAGFSSGWTSDYSLKLTPAHEAGFAKLLVKLPATPRGQLLKLGQIWGVKGVAEQLREIAASMLRTALDEKSTDEQRAEAAQQVVVFRGDDDETITKLLGVISARSSPILINGVFDALSNSQATNLGSSVVAKLPSLSPAGRTAALRLLLSRPTSTRALIDAFEKGTLSIGELSLDQKQALSSHTDATIAKRAKALLAKGGGLPDADRQKVIDEYISATKEKGNVEAGKLVFKNQCAKCHMHGTEGAKIGPDLTGVAVHTKEHMLIDILDPSRSVEGNFRIWKVTTSDGKSFTGLLASETKTSVEIIDAEAKKHVIQREDIEMLQPSAKSLMPEGFEKQIKERKELVDLLEFLAQKGKYLPIALDKAATIVSTKGMFFDESSTIERMIFPDWSPKTFKGVPFQLVDPQGDKARNVILLYGPQGTKAPTMPKSVTVPCNTAAKAIHLLSGASGWGYQGGTARNTVSMIVRLHYEDGKTEDHELKDGTHFADYIRKVDVPGSEFAFALRGQQIRYLAVTPKREDLIKEIEFVKGSDRTAPIVMAVTVETR